MLYYPFCMIYIYIPLLNIYIHKRVHFWEIDSRDWNKNIQKCQIRLKIIKLKTIK